MTLLATAENLRLVDALCRADFASFAQKAFYTLSPSSTLQMNYHLWTLAYHLELVRRGQIKRLIINLPPRTMKSLLTSVAFPAYVLGHDPGKRLIVVSYGADLAIKLSNDFRMIIEAPWYQSLFPLLQTAGVKNTEFEVATTRNGYRLATSIDGSLTGRGGDILIIDEPLKPGEASTGRREWVNSWFFNTLLSRLDNMSTGAIIVVMQRLHDDDLTGALLRSPEPWVLLKLPAIAEADEEIPIGPGRFHLRRAGDVLHPERMPLSELEARRTLDPEIFGAHYQQAPIPPGGIIIRREWVRYYEILPVQNSSSVVLQSWDPASKEGASNDWSVCTTWLIQDGNYYLMHVLRERLDFPSLRNRAIAHARAYNANKIIVEDAGVGIGLIQEMRKFNLPVNAAKPERNKKVRMQIQAAKFQDGRVYLPRQAPWALADYEGEIFAFPHARFDDQVDSTSQALAADHSTFNLEALAKGMERLCSGLAFDQFVRSSYHSKFG
jgi:predicted phage terminase large subunit-like protein